MASPPFDRQPETLHHARADSILNVRDCPADGESGSGGGLVAESSDGEIEGSGGDDRYDI